MSLTTAQRAGDAGMPITALRQGSAGATWALARAEARKLLRSPIALCSAGLTLVLDVVSRWTRVPDWDSVALDTGYTSLVLAAALVVLGHLAAGRDHRHGVTETIRALPCPDRRRTVALLVVAPVAALLGMLVVAGYLLSLWPNWPAGHFDWADLLVPVVLPVLGVTTGMAVGRWLPAAPAGALTVVVLAAGLIGFLYAIVGPDSALLAAAPVLNPPWIPGAPRPSGWHLAYLGGLVLVAACAALLRHRPRLLPALGAAAAVALVATSLTMQQARGPGVITEQMMARYGGPQAHECQRRGDVEYCPLRSYQRWVPIWRDAVQPVADAIPAAARPGLPIVYQLANYDGHDPDTGGRRIVFTSLTWGRHGRWEANSRADLAAHFAGAAVGLRSDDDEPEAVSSLGTSECWAGGQARTVIALWLAAQSMPDGARRLHDHRLAPGWARYGDPEVAAATALLAQPRSQITAALAAEWAQVITPTAGTGALAALGLGPITLSAPGREGLPTCI
jgi:hypothetical protein